MRIMNNNTAIAKNTLIKNGYTCVLYSNGIEHHSTLRGVKPLIDFLESDKDFNGFSAADKTVGAGAAHLYVLLGAKEVWANIISEEGRNILLQNNISVFSEKVVPYIINRTGDGVCPIETEVKGITCSKQAFGIIKQVLKELKNQVQK